MALHVQSPICDAVGLTNQVQPMRLMVYGFMEDFANATERLNHFMHED